jgi:hypothetical protein
LLLFSVPSCGTFLMCAGLHNPKRVILKFVSLL